MREILIEFEKVQIIRKRARTSIEYCVKCLEQVDFITLPKAADVFNTQTEHLIQFVNRSGSHFYADRNGDLRLCLNSLLENLNKEQDRNAKLLPAKKTNES